MNKFVEELRQIDTFSDLDKTDLESLAELCVPAYYPQGSVIAREGMDARSLFCLISGKVGIWVDYSMDNADLLALRGAPCLVGEMSIADQLPRSATIAAATDIFCLEMDAGAFRDLLQKRGHMALNLMKSISRLVRSSNDSFVSELRGRNAELVKANQELKAAQRHLVGQERLSSLGKFSSMIIHDLRNPLSVIIGYADLLELKLGDLSSDLQKYVGHIRRETGRLSGLIAEWLDYSRGEIRLAYAPTDVDKLFSQLRENTEPRLSGKNITLKTENSFKGVALLDSERMQRVLINLTDNARKACDRNGCICVSAEGIGERLVFTIEDDGAGMDSETLQHAFEPFYSRSEKGGTGLGMHIVKTVVESHDGHIDISSVPGEGTNIAISLPARI